MNKDAKHNDLSEQAESMIHVASFEEICKKGVVLAKGTSRPIAVFHSEGQVFAVDNRCPHLGFPLHKGTVSDGRLTCHWHEARFDLCSGCTFDLWADDVPAFETEIREGEVYVSMSPRQKEDITYYRQRLENGLRHNVNLVQAKAILGLRRHGVVAIDILAWIADFGSLNHQVWDQGMTILTIVGNLAPHLQPETLDHALIRACRQVAQDCTGKPQPRKHDALGNGEQSSEQLKRWLRDGVRGRQRDASERALQSLLFSSHEVASEAYFSAVSDRVYTDTGHQFDAVNKSFELLDQIGWEHADSIVPLPLQQVLNTRGVEESSSWHSPVELITPLRDLENKLPELLSTKQNKDWVVTDALEEVLLGDDALKILSELELALLEGAPPLVLAKAVAHAAAIRLAKFAKSNEVGDWFMPQHTFIFCNAVYQAIKRVESPDVVRSLIHGALAVYQDRFFNIPSAPLPKDAELSSLSEKKEELLSDLLIEFDQRSEWKRVGKLVARYLRLGHPLAGLIDTLTLATIREDLDFHPLQVLEAAANLARDYPDHPEFIEHLFIGSARQLHAICPTPRAAYKLGLTAARLGKGDHIFEE
ncbi:MAG: Rieske (2Fe-2S) protein [Akkermansiaceae bacterium]